MKIKSLAALMVLSLPVWAAPQTATLSVEGMTCAACPITVKKALGKVPGVSRAEIDFNKRQATVTYDDAKTSVEALMHATRDAGYPSTLAGNAK
jgi:mercuric ion binding protein